MKKTCWLAFFVGFSVVLGIFLINLTLFHNHLYAETTLVVHVSESSDTVTVEDFNGNLWQFKGIDDWYVGDVCSVLFDSKGTSEIKDDEIVKVKYSGYMDGWQ